MAIFSKKEIAVLLTEGTLHQYQDFSGIIAFISDQKICSENGSNENSTLSLDNLSALLEMYFLSLDVNGTLEACSRLDIRAAYNDNADEFHIIRKRQQYLVGTELMTTDISGVEMTLIKTDDGLVFSVESSYIEQDVDALISPYNNGLVILK